MTRLFYTPPLPIVDHPADAAHFTRGRGGFAPEWIVLHHTGGTSSLNWLSTTSAPPVSCHRLISKTGINYKIVADEDTAYCAGFAIVGPVDPDANDPAGVPRNFNQNSLNIELENRGTGRDPYPLAQMKMAASQIVEWWGKFGWLPIVYHRHVDVNKDDPAGFDRAQLDRLILTYLLEIGIVTP